jgi:hypothetical protein
LALGSVFRPQEISGANGNRRPCDARGTEMPEARRCPQPCDARGTEMPEARRCPQPCDARGIEMPEARRCPRPCDARGTEMPEAQRCPRPCDARGTEMPEAQRCPRPCDARGIEMPEARRCPRHGNARSSATPTLRPCPRLTAMPTAHHSVLSRAAAHAQSLPERVLRLEHPTKACRRTPDTSRPPLRCGRSEAGRGYVGLDIGGPGAWRRHLHARIHGCGSSALWRRQSSGRPRARWEKGDAWRNFGGPHRSPVPQEGHSSHPEPGVLKSAAQEGSWLSISCSAINTYIHLFYVNDPLGGSMFDCELLRENSADECADEAIRK